MGRARMSGPHGQQTARLGGELRLEGPDLIWKLRLRGRALVARKVGPVEPRPGGDVARVQSRSMGSHFGWDW